MHVMLPLIFAIATQTVGSGVKGGGWEWPICVCAAAVILIGLFLFLFREQIREKIGKFKGIGIKKEYEVLEKEEAEESKQIERDAKADYEQVRKEELSKKEIIPLREKALNCAQNNDYIKAEKIFREYKQKSPSSELVLSLLKELISIYIRQEQVRRAMLFMETEEEAFEKDYKFYETFSRVARTNKDWEKAFDYIKKAISLSPNNSECLSSLGYTYWLKGERHRAIEETEKALKYASSNNDILRAKNNLAYYYAEQGDVANEAKAREYAKYVYDNYDKTSEKYGSAISTYGYAIMKFARDLPELDYAISLFHDAIREGFSMDKALEHIREAEIKRKLLSKQS